MNHGKCLESLRVIVTDWRPKQILLTTCGAWSLPRAAKGFEARGALAGLWITHKNSTHVSREKISALLAVSSGDETVLSSDSAKLDGALLLRFFPDLARLAALPVVAAV
jgi:hypothetical protein